LHATEDTSPPARQPLHPTDRFKVNQQFNHALSRIKIPLIAYKNAPETDPQQKETQSQVDAHRRQILEATIVRIMKGRRQLTHTQLVTEVTTQVIQRFKPDPQDIKKRIEVLIEREYLQRDESNR
jgi:cullin 3